MNLFSFPRRYILALAVGLLLAGQAAAQEQQITEFHRRMTAGEIVEVMAVTPEPDAEYGWVLTLNGNFVEASRDPVFHTRLTQAGTYLLNGDIRIGEIDHRMRLTLEIAPRTGEQQDGIPSDNAPGIIIASTEPDLQSGHLPPDEENSLLTLTPSALFPAPIALDLDTTVDSDGNGTTDDDNDAVDTLFSIEHNPLHIWFTTPEHAAPLRLRTVTDDGTELSQTIGAGSEQPDTSLIEIGEEHDGVVKFSMQLDPGIPPQSVVYQWDFGDGKVSLVDAPEHRYFINGEYDVSVVVRDMATGREIAKAKDSATIASAIAIGTAVSSAGTSSSSSESSTPSSGGLMSSLGTIFRLLLLLVFAGALGAGGVWVWKKIRSKEGILQKALENAESRFVTKPGAATPDAAPATMSLKRSDQPAPVIDVEQQASAPAGADEQVIPPSQMPPPPEPPEWLKKGLEAAAQQPFAGAPPAQEPQTPAPPAPAPSTPTPPVAPTPEPPVPAPQPTLPVEPAPVAQPEPAAATPTSAEPPPLSPASEPVPIAPPEPPPAPAVVSEPPPAPASAPLPAPTLTPSSDPSVIAEAAVSSPTTEPAANGSLALPEDEVLPQWLNEGSTQDTPAPTDTAPIEPLAPAAPISAPETPVAAAPVPVPDPAPAPLPKPPAPAPTPAPPVTPPPALAAAKPNSNSNPNSNPNPIDPAAAERLERERERKRKKRQRYRENLKKRKDEGAQGTKGTKGTEVPQAPAKNEIDSKQSAKVAEQNSVPTVTPPPPPPKPVVKEVLPATPSQSPTANPSDDSVAFVIKAEGVSEEQEKKQNPGK